MLTASDDTADPELARKGCVERHLAWCLLVREREKNDVNTSATRSRIVEAEQKSPSSIAYYHGSLLGCACESRGVRSFIRCTFVGADRGPLLVFGKCG
jgi:hypothetical protein